MIKVMYFLKRAEDLSQEEFHSWWTEKHVPEVLQGQAPHLLGYCVNLKDREIDELEGKPAADAPWDGVAEMWYEDEQAFNAVYGATQADDIRTDRRYISRIERLLVSEIVAKPTVR